MSTSYAERLFYVVKETDTTYSLYSIQTDHLILAEVAADAISDFLFLNEPNNPALEVMTDAMGNLDKISNYNLYSDINLKDTINYYSTLSTCGSYSSYDLEATQFGTNSLKDYNLNNSDKQLSFNFSDNLTNALDNQKTNYTLNNSINNSSDLYIHTGKTNGPKTQYDSNSEWKILNIDDD